MLNNNFINLYTELINNQFLLVPSLYDNEIITEKSKYICVYKQTGAVMYSVLIINYDNMKDEYEKFQNKVYLYFSKMFNELNVKSIIFLTVFITEKADENLLKEIDKNDTINEEIADIKWIAENSSKKILINKNQPDRILNIHEILENILISEPKPSDYGQSVNEIIKNIKIKEKNELKSNNALITYLIIFINFIILALMELNGGSSSIDTLLKFGASEPYRIFVKHQYFRLFTAMFLHIGIMHLLANSLSLYIFGPKVEKYIGKIPFLIIYIFSGISGCALSAVINNHVSAGASGAIFGLTGAILCYSFVKNKSLEGFDFYFVIIISLLGILSGMLMKNVDNAGHIGGFAAGIIITRIIIMFQDLKIKKQNV